LGKTVRKFRQKERQKQTMEERRAQLSTGTTEAKGNKLQEWRKNIAAETRLN
jgi:hypothetical protein